MAYQFSYQSDFGIPLPAAYAAIIAVNWAGAPGISVVIGIYATQAAYEAKNDPLATFTVLVPMASADSLLTSLYADITDQIAAGLVPALVGAVSVT